jgi:hypothetical protein
MGRGQLQARLQYTSRIMPHVPCATTSRVLRIGVPLLLTTIPSKGVVITVVVVRMLNIMVTADRLTPPIRRRSRIKWLYISSGNCC